MNNVFKNATITQKLLLIVLGLMCTNQLSAWFVLKDKHWCEEYHWHKYSWYDWRYEPNWKNYGLNDKNECMAKYNELGVPYPKERTQATEQLSQKHWCEKPLFLSPNKYYWETSGFKTLEDCKNSGLTYAQAREFNGALSNRHHGVVSRQPLFWQSPAASAGGTMRFY